MRCPRDGGTMKSEEDDGRVGDMTEEELQHWVRERVESDEQLVQRRAQLAQVEEWVKQKESEAKHTQLLYNNACQSVFECESVMKGLYGMLGLEYRDTDSEAEGEEGGGEAKPVENVFYITDGFTNDEDNCDANGNDDDGDDYYVIDLGDVSVPGIAVKDEPKTVKVSAAIEALGSFVQKVEKTEAVDPPCEIEPPSLPPSPSATRRDAVPDEPLPSIKSAGSPVPVTAPLPCDLPMNETVESPPLDPIANASFTSANNQPKTPTETSAPVKHSDETPAHRVASTLPAKSLTSSKSSKTDSKGAKSSSATTDTAGKTTVKEKVKPDTPDPISKPSSTSTTPGTTPAEKAKSANSKQGDKPKIKPPPDTSSSHSGTTDTTTSEMTTKKTTSTKPPEANIAIVSQQDKPGTPASPSTAVRVQKEVPLKVNMSILGRRRTKTWYHGTILDIKPTDSAPRYKVLFDGGKGKSVLSAHHLACVNPPLLKDLFVGCRVVACYKEADQSWLHGAVVGEMPDRKNRMRFLVFFDDGRPAYISLPDLHLVCKPMANVTEDIEDKGWRAELDEYLQSYPNPIFVVMRVGQDSKVERNGRLKSVTITQVDSSLIEICYKEDQKKEWLYKGSNRLEQIQNIKKRMAEQKKDLAVNKAGWIVTQKNTNTTLSISTGTTNTTTRTATSTTTTTPAPTTPAPTTPAPTTTAPTTTAPTTPAPTTTAPTTTATSSTRDTTNIEPLKSCTTKTASQTVSTVTASSSKIKTFAGIPVSQPKVVLNRISLPLPPKPVKTAEQTPPTGTRSSNAGMKRLAFERDSKPQNALIPVVEPRPRYVPHRCCPACLNDTRPTRKDPHRGQNPLLIPLLHSFRRMTARRRVDGKMSFHVFYRAPCGRSMCEMEEVQSFLFESRCDFLSLDMFCLDPFVLVKMAQLPPSMGSRPYLVLPDISGGKEVVPVPCVNELNTMSPPLLTYTRQRLPGPGVFINTDPDFMVGCDCTDGCRDRSKCSCYQMTIEATSLFSGGPEDITAGYTHKRLPTYVPTGVYECNPLCRCDPWLCGNRLVQHGLQLRLEVFMTQNKGWGLRCLDDVSKGTFVCVFTGKVVRDEVVNAESALAEMSGNEYLANLDYIEGVEKLKEGYESKAHCSDTEDESDKKMLVIMDTSSSSEKDEATNCRIEARVKPCKRERKASDDTSSDDSEYSDDDLDEDYRMSSDDEMKAEWKCAEDGGKRSYTTRRNAKIPHEDRLPSDTQTSPQIAEEQTEVTASLAKKMRKEGPGGHKLGFAKKSTRAFAIKSSHMRVKPWDASPGKSGQEMTATHGRKGTRSLFNGEKACYLIDAKQEGNLARFINHSCSPNLFVQNVFVDTHDLRFPWVAFFTSKRIRAGTELTWDYSYEVGSVEGKVVLCCCGSSECTGRLL